MPDQKDAVLDRQFDSGFVEKKRRIAAKCDECRIGPNDTLVGENSTRLSTFNFQLFDALTVAEVDA